MALLSGVEAITPALEETKRQLFRPFRWGRWVRLAVVSFLVGEVTGGRWAWMNYSLSGGGRKSSESSEWIRFALPLGERFWEFLPLIIAGALALLFLLVFLIYVSSIFRFILFDSVLHDRCELGTAWRNYKIAGGSYFLWTIGFGLATLTTFAVVILVPILSPWGAEVIKEPGQHLVLMIAGISVMVLLVFVVIVLSALISLFARDFVVPVMALEGVGVLEAWRRLFVLVGSEKVAYTVYVLMKMVLALGIGILFTMVDVVVLIALLIPMLVVGFAGVLAGQAAGLTWTPATIALAALAGLCGLATLMSAMALVSVPMTVFFQSYALYFFGSRYPRLGEQMTIPARFSPSPGTLPPAAAPLPAT